MSDPTEAAKRTLENAAKATAGKAELRRYDHGGGRLAIFDGKERDLVADFYDEANREYFEAVRTDAPLIAQALLDATDDLARLQGVCESHEKSLEFMSKHSDEITAERDRIKADRDEYHRLVVAYLSADDGERNHAHTALYEHSKGNGWIAAPEPVVAQVVRERDQLTAENKRLRELLTNVHDILRTSRLYEHEDSTVRDCAGKIRATLVALGEQP